MCIVIRKAKVSDCRGILDLITELAIFEKQQHQLKMSLEKLQEDGFGEDKQFQCFVAECKEKDTCASKLIGYVIYFNSYSTWQGNCMHMDDIYVLPEYRNMGIGSKLIGSVCKEADLQKCARVDFIVRDSNKSAINFYQHQGATDVTKDLNWHLFRLTSDAIKRVAAKYVD